MSDSATVTYICLFYSRTMAILPIFLAFGVLLAANGVFAPPPVSNKGNSNAGKPGMVTVTLRLDSKKNTCVSPDGNTVVAAKRANVKLTSCKCFADRLSATPPPDTNWIGGYIPQCDDNTGTYLPLQMHLAAGFSWCVDPEGKQKGESTRNIKSLKC